LMMVVMTFSSSANRELIQVEDLPDEIRNEINFIAVNSIKDVITKILKGVDRQ